jgi:hypothetical protein
LDTTKVRAATGSRYGLCAAGLGGGGKGKAPNKKPGTATATAVDDGSIGVSGGTNVGKGAAVPIATATAPTAATAATAASGSSAADVRNGRGPSNGEQLSKKGGRVEPKAVTEGRTATAAMAAAVVEQQAVAPDGQGCGVEKEAVKFRSGDVVTAASDSGKPLQSCLQWNEQI